MLFQDLEEINENHIALKYYRAYRSGSGKTLKSIQITLAARLEKFGYSVSVLELTDPENTPKNTLLRAILKKGGASKDKAGEYDSILKFILGDGYTDYLSEICK